MTEEQYKQVIEILESQNLRLESENKKLKLKNKELIEKFSLYGVGFSWPSKKAVSLRLKQLDETWQLGDRKSEKQAFEMGFNICFRWLKNLAE